MLARIHSSALSGLDAQAVDVEVRTEEKGRRSFTLIGLGDGAIRESKDRVEAALRQSGFFIPARVLVNLAPAALRKEGSSFDLAIAIGIIAASGQVPTVLLPKVAFHGELALDGTLKSVRGTVAYSVVALEAGREIIAVPQANRYEAGLVGGLKVVALDSLSAAVRFLRGALEAQVVSVQTANSLSQVKQLSDVRGQVNAKRALIIAASGRHNLLMVGPPGCGKSMLASRLPGLLPDLSRSEMLEVSRIHSIAGLPVEGIIGGRRPFRAPHHTISEVGLIGGGAQLRPGEVSLAHNGVLFLDELPEFRRAAIESLRAPLESGMVHIARARGMQIFPADIQLIAAMNPCPCGMLGSKNKLCRCAPGFIRSYLSRLSEPILDRIDLQVELEAVEVEQFTAKAVESAEQPAHEQVLNCVDLQFSRQGCYNAALGDQELFERVELGPSAMKLIKQASDRGTLSARGLVRILKVARTIADLDNEQKVCDQHLLQALNFRSLEKVRRFCEAA